MMKERGCGKRTKGGLYACCGLSPYGKPIEDFLIDPPLAFSGESFRAPIVNVVNEVTNLIFWMGKEFYPYCPDYIEETRVMGALKERGCGKRTKGGLYACCGLSPYGKPIEDFLIDPPLAFSGESFRAPIVNVVNEVTNLIFWMGKEFYPYCPDYIEETRVMGISKRVPLGFDFKGVVPFESSMYFIHPRAIIASLYSKTGVVIDKELWKPATTFSTSRLITE